MSGCATPYSGRSSFLSGRIFPKPYALKPKTLASIQEYSLNYIGTGLRYSKPYSNYCGSKFLKKILGAGFKIIGAGLRYIPFKGPLDHSGDGLAPKHGHPGDLPANICSSIQVYKYICIGITEKDRHSISEKQDKYVALQFTIYFSILHPHTHGN